MAKVKTAPLTFAGIFEGIGGFTLGFQRRGWKPTAHVEINKYRQKVLARHWPDIPQMGDVSDVHGRDLGNPTALIGGFPCEGVSSAAPNRHGLRDARSNLYWQYHRLVGEVQRVVDESRPDLVIIENAPGLLRSGPKSDKGADMEAVLRSLVELGYGVAYRTVDSNGLGSSQRRNRLYIVGHRSGDPRVAWRVLGDADGGSVDSGGDDPSRRTRAQRSPLVGSAGGDGEDAPQAFRKSRNPRGDWDYSTWVPAQHLNTLAKSEGGTGEVERQRHLVLHKGRLRVLVPQEWEFGQGFPRDWTAGIPDSQRFQALGDAQNVYSAEWLAVRAARVLTETPLLPVVGRERRLRVSA